MRSDRNRPSLQKLAPASRIHIPLPGMALLSRDCESGSLSPAIRDPATGQAPGRQNRLCKRHWNKFIFQKTVILNHERVMTAGNVADGLVQPAHPFAAGIIVPNDIQTPLQGGSASSEDSDPTPSGHAAPPIFYSTNTGDSFNPAILRLKPVGPTGRDPCHSSEGHSPELARTYDVVSGAIQIFQPVTRSEMIPAQICNSSAPTHGRPNFPGDCARTRPIVLVDPLAPSIGGAGSEGPPLLAENVPGNRIDRLSSDQAG